MKYTDAREGYFDWLKPAKRSKNSLRAYRSDLDTIAELLGDPRSIRVTELTRERMRRAFGMFAEDHEGSTIIRAHGTWDGFFDFLVADGIVEGNPMAAVPRPKRGQREPKPLAGWDEGVDFKIMKALKDGARGGRHPWPELDVAVVATLFAAGPRASELLALNIGSIEGRPPDQVIRIRRGKGDKDRAVPIEPELDIILGDYLESRRDRYPLWKPKPIADPLFVAARPGRPNSGGVRMTEGQLRYLLETGLEASGFGNARQPGTLAHAFRHTFGTVLAAGGGRVTAIQKLMGHASLNTTQGYIDSVGRDQREDAARNPVYGALARLTNA